MRTIVFLGDSMTEGVGSQRVSFVTEMQRLLAAETLSVQITRARKAETLGRFAGHLWNWVVHTDPDVVPMAHAAESDFVLVNLAAEGTTVEYDLSIAPLLSGLQPDAVVVFRGVVEAVHRIAPGSALHRCLPARWRTLGGLDPRCYFSDEPMRRAKQQIESGAKSWLRKQIMRVHGAQPIMSAAVFEQRLNELVSMVAAGTRSPVLLCTLPPVRGDHFPGSATEFARYNQAIDRVARATANATVAWHSSIPTDEAARGLYFADGLHLNATGNARLAATLLDALRALGLLAPEPFGDVSTTSGGRGD